MAVSTWRPDPQVVRASGVLTGSYVLAPNEIDVTYALCGRLLLHYVAGGAGGYASFYAQGRFRNETSARWYDLSILDGTITKTGFGYVTSLGRHVVNLATGSQDLEFTIGMQPIKRLRFYFAEVGNPGSPGTLAAELALEMGA